MLVLHDRVASRRLGLDERVVYVVHRTARHVMLREDVEPFARRPLPQDSSEDRDDLLAVPAPRADAVEPGIGSQVGAPDRVAKAAPQALLRAGDNDPSVARRE